MIKMIEKFKQYILAGISLLVGAFLPYIYSYADLYAKNAQVIIYILSIALFVVGLLIITWIEYQRRTHRVKYSVLIFAVDKKNRLLTIYNKYHQRIMIPCGIIPSNLTPNETVALFLKEQAGLDEGDYQNVYFDSKKQLYKPEICPIDTQIEFVTKHEKHVKLHYAFVYYIRVNDNSKIAPNTSFVKLEQLNEMPQDKGLFSDLLARYKFMLNELEKGGN